MKRTTGIWVGPLLNLALRLTRRRAGVALVYHTIDIRQGDSRRELVPPLKRSRFARQLRHLKRFYEVVPPDGFFAAVSRRRRGQRFPVCVTFDDDAPQHVRHALPELRNRGIQATFFLCGAFLEDGSGCFWWERLQRAVDRGVPMSEVASLLPTGSIDGLQGSPHDIHRIADAVTEMPPRVRDKFNSDLIALAGPDPPGASMSTEDVKILNESGFGIGFHTRRHEALTILDDDALSRALSDGRRDLERLIQRPLDILAYPHGRADGRVATAARQSGFRFGFTAVSAAVTSASDPLRLERIEPLVRSDGAFALRMVRALMASDSAERA